MTSFFIAYRNEWSKLMLRKKYVVFLCIGIAGCLIWTALGRLLAGFVKRGAGVTLVFTPTPMGALPFFLQVLIPFLMFMGVTDLITAEGAENTMKAMLCRPVERYKLYAAKLLAPLTYAVLYLACVFAVCAALSRVFGKAQGAGAVLTSLASYALTVAPLAVLVSFAGFVALLGRSGTLTMFILLLSYLILRVLPIFFPILTEMLFTSYLSWYNLWIGALPGFSKLLRMLLTVFGYGAVFFTAGSLAFDWKEY